MKERARDTIYIEAFFLIIVSFNSYFRRKKDSVNRKSTWKGNGDNFTKIDKQRKRSTSGIRQRTEKESGARTR